MDSFKIPFASRNLLFALFGQHQNKMTFSQIKTGQCSRLFFWSRLSSLLILGFITQLTPDVLQAQNQVGERDNFHNTAYVDTDDDAMKAELFAFHEALGNKNHATAIAHLLQVLKMDTDTLVPFGERTFLSVRETCLRHIASMPVDAIRNYLEKAEREASELLKEATSFNAKTICTRISAQYPFTPTAFNAQALCGDLAFERGAYLEAASWYRRVLHESMFISHASPGTDDELTKRSRLSLYISLILAGQPEEAAPFKPEGARKLGDATLDPEAVEDLLEGIAPDPATTCSAWRTRGGERARARLPSCESAILIPLWTYSLKEAGPTKKESPLDLFSERLLDAKRKSATVFPIVHDNMLLVFDESALHPLDLETGKLLYGPVRWDWSLLFGDQPLDLESIAYSGTVHDDTLFVSLNRCIQDFGEPDQHLGICIAFDLRRESHPLWKRGGLQEQDPRLHKVAFSGSPLVLQDRVFIIGTRYAGSGEDRAESHLFCFDHASGRLVFDRFLCSGAEISRFEIRLSSDFRKTRDRVELGSPIAEAAGALYCLTNLGVIAKIDAFTGDIFWIFKYNRVFSQDPDQYYPDFFLDTGGWKDGLPMVREDRLYVTPEDSRYFYCLDLCPDNEGFLILDDPIEKGRKITFIGMDHRNHLYFTAREGDRNYLIATERNGAILWETPHFERQDRLTGRPLLTKDAVLVPTKRYIYRIDIEKEGLVTDMFPLPEAVAKRGPPFRGFGNIIAIKDLVVSVSNEDVILIKAAQGKK